MFAGTGGNPSASGQRGEEQLIGLDGLRERVSRPQRLGLEVARLSRVVVEPVDPGHEVSDDGQNVGDPVLAEAGLKLKPVG